MWNTLLGLSWKISLAVMVLTANVLNDVDVERYDDVERDVAGAVVGWYFAFSILMDCCTMSLICAAAATGGLLDIFPCLVTNGIIRVWF